MDRQDTSSRDISPFSTNTNQEIIELRQQINMISHMLFLSGERERHYQEQINQLNKKYDELAKDASTHNYNLSYNMYLLECRFRVVYQDYKHLHDTCMRLQRDSERLAHPKGISKGK